MWLLFFMSTFSSSQIWCKQGVASLIAKHLKVKFAMTRKQGIRNGQSSKKSSDREVRLFGVQLTEGMMRKSISMGNLSHFAGNGNQASTIEHSESGAMADGYLSDGIVQASGNVRERRKGVPWTEKEHRLFLIGLQKLGKGDWRGIAKNFVTTRNATQVASHAQKYFLRQSNLSRRKKRSSLFDIIPESEANFPEDTKVNLADMSSPLSQLSLEQGSGVLSTDYMEHSQFPALQFPIPPTTPVPGASCGLASNNHEPVSFFLTVAHGSLAEGENHKDCTVSTTSEAPNVQLSSILPTSAFPEAFSLWDKLFPPPSSSKISTIVKPIATVSSAPLRIDHVLKSPELESDHASIRPSPLSLQLIQPSRISAFHVKSSFRGNSCSGAKLDEAISVL